MDIGLCIPPTMASVQVAAHAETAETAGFDHIRITDTQGLWHDLYVSLSLVAERKTTARISSTVTNVTTRHLAGRVG